MKNREDDTFKDVVQFILFLRANVVNSLMKIPGFKEKLEENIDQNIIDFLSKMKTEECSKVNISLLIV